MKKIILILILLLSGCVEQKEVTLEEAFSKVEEYFYNNNENFSSYGIGESKIIIELLDDSPSKKEAVENALKDYMKFIEIKQGGPYNTSSQDKQLEVVNQIVIDYFLIENYLSSNHVYNYVDYDRKKVVIGMLDVSEEKQQLFKEEVINSMFLHFEVSDPLHDLRE